MFKLTNEAQSTFHPWGRMSFIS